MSDEEDSRSRASRRESLEPGSPELGTLHSDPEIDAASKVLEEIIDGGSEETPQSSGQESESTEADRLDLLLELLEAKREADGELGPRDVEVLCPRPPSVYAAEFGSLEQAVEQISSSDESNE